VQINISQCLLCNLPESLPRRICTACLDSLPWLQHACLGCGLELPRSALHEGRCGNCLSTPRRRHQYCQSALHYDCPVDWLIARFKFRADFACGVVLASLLAQRLQSFYEELPRLIIPAPLHSQRFRERGYNQAAELARRLSKTLSIDLRQDVLFRIRPTSKQSELGSRRARAQNMRGAFHADVSRLTQVDRVILLDDVITTMSTIEAAREALLKAGISRVDAWSVARVTA